MYLMNIRQCNSRSYHATSGPRASAESVKQGIRSCALHIQEVKAREHSLRQGMTILPSGLQCNSRFFLIQIQQNRPMRSSIRSNTVSRKFSPSSKSWKSQLEAPAETEELLNWTNYHRITFAIAYHRHQQRFFWRMIARFCVDVAGER